MTLVSRLRRVAAAFVVVAGFLWAPAADAIEVKRVVAGDLEAWLIEDHTNPIIAMRIAFRGGAAADPKDKAGLARMATALLDEGAGELDSQAFQHRLEELAVELQFGANLDSIIGVLETLSENRDEAFRLLGLAVSAPRFDAEPVARIRSQLLAMLRHDAEDPETIARRRFFAQMFPDHPYGRPVDGTPESIAAIGVDDLRNFAARRLARDNLVVGVVGDLTPEELGRLLKATLAALPAASVPVTIANIAPNATGITVVVDHPGRQSAIVFGQNGVKRDDPQFYAATVLNHILGGGTFTSRLFDQVREKRGLAYSIYTSLLPLDHAALLLGGAGTANERAADTLVLIRDIWRETAEGGVTPEELADAKTYLTGSFPLRFTASGRIAQMLVAMQLENLGIDYLDRRNALIEAVTLDDVNGLAQKLLDARTLTDIVVGEPVGVTPSP